MQKVGEFLMVTVSTLLFFGRKDRSGASKNIIVFVRWHWPECVFEQAPQLTSDCYHEKY